MITFNLIFKSINLLLPIYSLILADAPVSWQFGFQNPATPIMEGITTLYNYIFIFLILVFVVVVWFFSRSLYLFRESRNPVPFEFNHDPLIETVWTVAPAFILIGIAVPSFSLLYAMDEVISPMLTVKIIGHQWYWSYELNVSRVDYYFDYVNANLPKVKGKYITKPIYTFKQLSAINRRFAAQAEGPSLWRRSLTFKTLQHTIRFKPSPYLYNFSSMVERGCKIARHGSHDVFSPREVDTLVKVGFKRKMLIQKQGLFHLLAPVGWDRQNRHSFSFVSPPLKFDSYMVPEADLPRGGLRLLEVDNRLVLPIGVHIRLLITSTDVIHSWAVPSLGVKVDAIPGRLNQIGVFIKRPGVFYGQCSELCGVNHAFMPIVVEGVEMHKFIKWARARLQPNTLAEFKTWTATFN